MKVLLFGVFCLVISESAVATPESDSTVELDYTVAIPAGEDDALAIDAFDTDAASDANIQKGEMLQEIGRQVKAVADSPATSEKKAPKSKVKRFFKAVKKAFTEACKAFVKTGKKVFISEVKGIFKEEIAKMKKKFGMYSLDENEATYRHMLLYFAEDMELIGSMYIAKGNNNAVGKEATPAQ